MDNITINKTTKNSDLEKANKLQNKKLAHLTQENVQLAAKQMELTDKLRATNDELFDLGG